MAFGKFFLLPVIGGTLFGWLTYALKTLHNFVGPLFAVSLVVVFFTFVRDNLPTRDDLDWLAKGGGMLGGQEVPSHRFNAGEKVIFWGGVFLLGADRRRLRAGARQAAARARPTRAATMQVAHMVHAVAAVLMMAMFLGHIYLGTIGMKRRLHGDAHRLRRRRLGARAPRAVVRGHQGRQDPGAAQRPRRRAAARADRRA